MKTKILRIDSPKEEDKIIEAANALKEGKLVVFPTETVYGLGADGLNPGAVEKIYKAKGRPSDNPFILHIAEMSQVYGLVKEVPKVAKDCMEMFWPGPLTIIFHKSGAIPRSVTAGLNTVGIRMPSHEIGRSILAHSGVAVAAPSANLSGKPSPTKAEHAFKDLNGKVDIIVDSGRTDVGIESTVLDVTVDPPIILRPGGVTYEDLKVLIPNIKVDEGKNQEDTDFVPKSPGQKYKHYAPNAECILFGGNLQNISKEINKRSHQLEGKKVAVLATTETIENYKDVDILINMGSRENLQEVASNIFDALRTCDEQEADIIYVEGFEFIGLGVGIMNRLLKACGGKVVLGL